MIDPVTFQGLPSSAAWRHQAARDGFEVVFTDHDGAHRLSGATCAVEIGEPWTVRYRIEVDADWVTRRVDVASLSRIGERSAVLEHDGAGSWRLNGTAMPSLRGCLDVDLESSAVTNTLPVHRLTLAVSECASVPAAYIRAGDLKVERLEQTYQRLPDGEAGPRYLYRADAFDFSCELQYDQAGLVTEYPGLARRAR